MTDHAARLQGAAKLIRQSPPGELREVLASLCDIVTRESISAEVIQNVLRDYNESELAEVVVDGQKTLISRSTRLGDRYYDSKSRRSFEIDHYTLVTSQPEPRTLHPEIENVQATLSRDLDDYIGDRYPDGVSNVIGTGDEIVLHIVDSKYNLNNFWTGRWRSIWRIDLTERVVKGIMQVRVHYYEEGNVQVEIAKDVTIALPDDILLPASMPASQVEINAAQDEMPGLTGKDSHVQKPNAVLEELATAEPQETSPDLDAPVSTSTAETSGGLGEDTLDTVDAANRQKVDDLAVATDDLDLKDMTADALPSHGEVSAPEVTSSATESADNVAGDVLQQVSGSAESAERSADLAAPGEMNSASAQNNVPRENDIKAPAGVQMSATDYTATSKIIVKIVKSCESAWQDTIQSAYTDLNERIFRGLRRPLPVTKEKIRWDGVAAYRAARVGAQQS